MEKKEWNGIETKRIMKVKKSITGKRQTYTKGRGSTT